jgi:hypothetical protein
MWGYFENMGKMSGNSMRAGLKGPVNVRFKDGHHIRYSMSEYKLGGTIMGSRTAEIHGNMVFEDFTNNIMTIVCMGTYRSTGFWSKTISGSKSGFSGIIYQPKEQINPVKNL